MDRMLGIGVTLKKQSNCVPKEVNHFTFSPVTFEFQCVLSLPALDVLSLFNFSHSNGCIVECHLFNLHFLNDYGCWTSFYVFISYLYILLAWYLFKSFAYFLNWATCLIELKRLLIITYIHMHNFLLYLTYVCQMFSLSFCLFFWFFKMVFFK